MPRPGIKQQQLDQHHQAEENVDLGRVADEVVVNAQQKDQQSEQAGQQPGAGYQLVGIVQAADEPYNLFSPCLRTFILRPLIGIITKTDSPYANVPMIKQWLLNAGCDRIFLVNNVTREGIDELMEYLAEDPVKITMEQAKFKQHLGLNEWDPLPDGVEYPDGI